jgi:hypothetical protein
VLLANELGKADTLLCKPAVPKNRRNIPHSVILHRTNKPLALSPGRQINEQQRPRQDAVGTTISPCDFSVLSENDLLSGGLYPVT